MQSPIANRLGRLSQGKHFGVCRRVIEKLPLIVRLSDNSILIDNHSANRNIAVFLGDKRLVNRHPHITLVDYCLFCNIHYCAFGQALGQPLHPPDRGGSLTTAAKLDICFSIFLPQPGQAGALADPLLTNSSSTFPQAHLYSKIGIN
jgi:hypothetical protein